MFFSLSNSDLAKENMISKDSLSIACSPFRGVGKGSPTYSEEMSFLERCGGWYLLIYIQQCLVYELSVITYCNVEICAVRAQKSLT